MRIIWRRIALNDLGAIREFIAHDNPNAATGVASAIREAVSPLGNHPHLGRADRVEGTRELIIAGLPYIVVYRVADEVVRILAVMQNSRGDAYVAPMAPTLLNQAGIADFSTYFGVE